MKRIHKHLKNLNIQIPQDRIHLKKTLIDKTTLIILCISPLFCFAWWWGYHIDNVNEYDFFIFTEFSQKIMWYFHYSAYHLENIIIHAVIYRFSIIIESLSLLKIYSQLKFVTEILFYFSIFRLLEYWMYRGQTSILELSVSLFLISIITLIKWLRNS